ncbi:MAG TPA: hypothetical protein PLB55_23505 [Prosthecobacter sp.]|jgi:hypothetical protein|nr:hypothetical protein [Prosthecobacter sp.]
MGQPACKLLDIPGTLLLDWDDPLRADHYRVWLFIVGTDTEFHALICRMSRMGPMA